MTTTGLTLDALFVGATRPPMRWGVTYTALLLNVVFTMEVFLATKNLVMLTVSVPIHGACMGLCARDPRFFDLALLWARSRLPALLSNFRHWRASSYGPLVLDMADAAGRRRGSHASASATNCAVMTLGAVLKSTTSWAP